METLPIQTVYDLMNKALALRGITGDDAEIIISDYLGAQLAEKYSHGLGKFLLLDSALAERLGSPTAEREHGATLVVNGNRELGQLAARYCIERLIPLARQNGIGVVALRNASRYSRLTTFGTLIAEAGLVGLVLNTGGPAAVAPSGSIDPIFGTNPICFSFPTSEDPLLIDFSSSKAVWGEIRQAILEDKPLPENAFLDRDGLLTNDPRAAEAVLPFDGYKGSSLCMAIEILAGALVGAKMGIRVDNQYDLGFLFLAIDPEVMAPNMSFRSLVADLLAQVRQSRGQNALSHPRIPGEESRRKRQQWESQGRIRVDSETLRNLQAMSQSREAGLASNPKTD